MPFHRAAIRQDDGTLLAKDIDVALEETTSAGVAGWHATVTARGPITLAAGQRYRLELDDGREGEFVVRRNTLAGGVDRAVSIVGTGALK